MAHCYRCGTRILEDERHLRRSVPTGGWISKSYPAAGLKEAKTRYGRRVVCRRCARLLDVFEGRAEDVERLKLKVALAVLAGILLWKAYGALH